MNNSMASQNTSNAAVSILDCCRRYVDKCIATQFQSVHSASKLASQLFDLMRDIGQNLSLKPSDFQVLFQWIQGLSTNNDQSGRTLSQISTALTYLLLTIWLIQFEPSRRLELRQIAHQVLCVCHVEQEQLGSVHEICLSWHDQVLRHQTGKIFVF